MNWLCHPAREGLTCMIPGAEGASCTSPYLGSPYVLHILCMFVADLRHEHTSKRINTILSITWTLLCHLDLIPHANFVELC